MKNADLVNLPPAICALHERLHLQDVILRRLELGLGNVPALNLLQHHVPTTIGSDTSKLLHTRTLQNTEKSTR